MLQQNLRVARELLHRQQPFNAELIQQQRCGVALLELRAWQILLLATSVEAVLLQQRGFEVRWMT